MIEQAREAAKPSTPVPTIGGVLSIVSGVFTLLLVFIPLTMLVIDPGFNSEIAGAVSIGTYFRAFAGLRIIWLFTSILGIVGGIFAIRRKHWIVSLLGAVASIISFTGLMGIVATVLIAISKKEFTPA
jgi:uncharacterized membrane protein HdeD (DUF308 family)